MGFEGTTLWRVRQRVGTDLLLWPGASVMVVRDDGRVLMGRRLDNGLWAIPGGGAEEGSSFSETAVAELREEVGLAADPADLEGYACISRADNHLETYPNGDVTHYFGVWFVLRRWQGDPAGDGEEMGEVAWVDVGDPPEPLLRSTRVGLELYRAWLASGRFQAY
jgi:8-oxo-dGTP pyrophosphatase MutT (NUDIX family)